MTGPGAESRWGAPAASGATAFFLWIAISASLPTCALAHGIAGNRFFPATLTIDDPAVADELSLPTVSLLDGDANQTDVAAEFSKRLTRTFGLSIGETWSHVTGLRQTAASGLDNLETTAKWQVVTSASHELIVSLGLSAAWGGTGAAAVGAVSHDVFTPTLYVGKGGGDLPDTFGWAKPFAITGAIGFALPSHGHDPREIEPNPRALEWGLTL